MSEYGFPWFEFIGLLLTGAGMLAGVWYRLHTQITTHREYVLKDLAKLEQGFAKEIAKLDQAHSVQIAALNMVIGDFKLEVARNYATNNSIREVEQRVVDAIDRLGDRLDKFLENRNRT